MLVVEMEGRHRARRGEKDIAFGLVGARGLRLAMGRDLPHAVDQEPAIVRVELDVLQGHPGAALGDPLDGLLQGQAGARRGLGVLADRQVAGIELDAAPRQRLAELQQALALEQRMAAEIVTDLEVLPGETAGEIARRRLVDDQVSRAGHRPIPAAVSALEGRAETELTA